MKNPFVITLIIFILFAVLVVFSVFKGPIKTEGLLGEKGVDPIIKMNRAVSSGDIEKCEKDVNCKNVFIFTQALRSRNPEDCNKIEYKEIMTNCKNNIFFSNAIAAEDKELCTLIYDTDMRNRCKEI
jgi:hypothetical protein